MAVAGAVGYKIERHYEGWKHSSGERRTVPRQAAEAPGRVNKGEMYNIYIQPEGIPDDSFTACRYFTLRLLATSMFLYIYISCTGGVVSGGWTMPR